MLNTQINITTTTIDGALAAQGKPVCGTCNVAVPIITGICESCE